MVAYGKEGDLRLATFVGLFCSFVSFIVAIVYFIMKLVNWDNFDAGMAPVTIGIFLLGGIQLIFICLIGEYTLNINTRVIHRPLVVEEKRINF